MEIEGIIKMELPVRSGVSAQTGKPWRIASYVLETISSYPKRMAKSSASFPLALVTSMASK